MATKRIVKRRPILDDLDHSVQEYLLNRSMREKSSYWENRIKGDLMNVLAETGELHDGGHRTIELDEPLSYQQYKGELPIEKKVIGIERKRRETTSLNEERLMKLLEKLKLKDQCTETQIVINEDKVLAAMYNGDIPEEDLDACYDKGENFAFYLIEEK